VSSEHSQQSDGPPDSPVGPGGPPAPPRSRMRAHVLAVVVGLVVTPVALYLALYGIEMLLPLDGPSDLLGAGPFLLGALVLGVLGAVAAWGSSLALGVGGLVWGVLPGLVGLPLLRPLLGPDTPTVLVDPLLRPLASGLLLVAGAALAAGGAACHLARRAGRSQEREEATLEGTGTAPAPVPPRSRMWGHAVSVFFSLVLLPPVAVLLGRGTTAALVLGLSMTSQPWQEPSLLAGAALLAVVVLLGGLSSLGPQLAGWLLLVVGALPVLHAHGWRWLAPLLDALGALPGGFQLLASGAWLLLGAVLVVCGGAAHWARRSGRRYERTDLALSRADV
jgi:MFS family permease